MKRLAAVGMAICIFLTACGGMGTVTGTGKVQPPDPSQNIYSAESPDAEAALPLDRAPQSSEDGESEPPLEESEEPSSSAPPESSAPSADPEPSSVPAVSPNAPSGEVRAVWISYLEFLNVGQNRSKSQFTSSISSMFDEAADFGLNTVYVQVRPFGDALYESDYFPWSYVLTGEEGIDPGYDPLAVMVSCARDSGLRIEAWINPYRVRAAGSSRELDDSNPAARSLSSGGSLAVAYNGGVFYNPASQEARNLITDGVVEILKKYDVDGIHFDDYFYPTTDAAFDAAEYASYQNGGGSLSLADWRRQNVTALIRQVASAVREADSSAAFGISPQARMDINYNQQYADIGAWCRAGWLDYVCPQIYFGFDHDTVPFDACADEWNDLVGGTGTVLYTGLAAYKCGASDGYAGGGVNEWLNNSDLLSQMVKCARKLSGYGGFAVYRYDSLFSPDVSVSGLVGSERENLAAIL